MKRTQLYIEEDLFKALEKISDQEGVSISELVRNAIRKAYVREKPADADLILKKAAGLWKNRKDLLPVDEYIRRMRRDTRRERRGIM